MKKLYVTIALLLCGFAQVAEAQNMYRNYLSANVRKPTSAVSVVHSNGYVYFFQTDGNGILSATEIDPFSMLPTGNDYYYNITQQNFNFNLNGGFEDANGKIVLFGYVSVGLNKNPAYVIIPYGLLSCDAYSQSGVRGEFTAGCDGFDQSSGEVYMFVNDKMLVAVEATSPTTLYPSELDAVAHPLDYYSDISWDAAHHKFIASGFAQDNYMGLGDPFVQVFDLNNYTINTFAEYCVLNNTYIQSNEYKTLHVQLDNDNLLLYYDLRHWNAQYTHDVIWLTRIRNFWNINTATVSESMLFELPNTKLSARDMLYDPYNNRLNFLGYFNKCVDGLIPLLAQVDPYVLSSGINIGQLGAAFTGGYCLNDYYPMNEKIFYNDFEMFNLALNRYNPCYPVLIAGVDNERSILTETYDISPSSCDRPMWHKDMIADTIIKPYTLIVVDTTLTISRIPVNAIPDNVTKEIICDEIQACSHQFGGKSLQESITNDKPVPEITLENNSVFICEGFEGVIQYFLYDIAGKLLQQGTTRNYEGNMLKKSSGMYLLNAVDSLGNRVVKKIVLL